MSGKRSLSLSGISVLFYMKGTGEPVCGAEITNALGYGPGTVYPLLANLEQKGFLTSIWEVGLREQLGRPLKQFFELTPAGTAKTNEELLKMRLLIAKIDT